MRRAVCAAIGIAGSVISSAIGGFDNALITLILFMIADYISGIAITIIWKKSPKSENGGLSSSAGFIGLSKKIMTLVYVLVCHRVDILMGWNFAREACIIGFIANELISLAENASIMGIKLPPIISNTIDILNKRSEKNAD